jgi:hypothetical protein
MSATLLEPLSLMAFTPAGTPDGFQEAATLKSLVPPCQKESAKALLCEIIANAAIRKLKQAFLVPHRCLAGFSHNIQSKNDRM